jgi:cytochrome c
MFRFLIACAVSLACGEALTTQARAQSADDGRQVFKQACGICHAVQAGRNGVGPSLFGVVGRKTGSVPGFHYSDANKNAGLTWDATTLNRYLTNPRGVVPGTTMAYAGLKDDTKRTDVIAYLATLK